MLTDRLSALAAEADEDRRWDALRAFVAGDTSAALEVGVRGLASADPRTRQIAADVLGAAVSTDRSMAPAVADALLPCLPNEHAPAVLDSLIAALGHAEDDRARSAVLAYADHPNENVRLSVAWSLPSLGLDDAALTALRRLSADTDSDVRDWATFGLAQATPTTRPPSRRSRLGQTTRTTTLELKASSGWRGARTPELVP